MTQKHNITMDIVMTNMIQTIIQKVMKKIQIMMTENIVQ